MQSKLDAHILIARRPTAEPARQLRTGARAPVDAMAPRADATWQASSFDLAQGLEVKVMESKLSLETLDKLFRS